MRRINPKPEFAMQQRVEQMWERFEYPDIDRDAIPFELGGAGGAPTVVVAASDASDLSKQKADYICTGSNDQDVIQAAISQLTPTSPFQGIRVLLTEGTFNINMAGQAYEGVRLDYGHIEGMGTEATILNATSDPPVADNPILFLVTGRCTVSHLSFQGGASTAVTGIDSSGDYALIDDVSFSNVGHAVIINTTSYQTIRNCYIESDEGIQINGSLVVNIEGNYISGTAAAVEVISTSSFVRIVGNYSETEGPFIQAVGGSTHLQESVIVANVVEYVGTTGPSGDPIIDLDNSYHIKLVVADNSFDNGTGLRIGNSSTLSPVGGHVIVGNTFTSDDTGIYLARCDRSVIAHNRFAPDGHGIVLDDTSECLVQANIIEGFGQFANNTYDAIHVENESDENLITANMLIPRASGNLSRYGVNVADSTCDCNIIVGNRLSDPADYGTDALNDAGTDTQLFYPNDPTYGDNFTDCTPTSPSSPTSP